MQIEIESASVSFGARVVFEHLSATFKSNELTALVGPSGSGKTSLLAAIAGYGGLAGGDIHFVAEEGDRMPPLRELVVWVSQGANALGARTALDNVMIGALSSGFSLDAAETRAASALIDVGLRDNAFQQARELSGGELQRLSFARALATNCPIILADEPSSSLDAANTEAIAELLRGLRSRATIIVATHDPTLVDAAEAVVDMRGHHAE